jgi:hypothetical protein
MKDHDCCAVAASGVGRETIAAPNSDGARRTRKFVRRLWDVAGLDVAEWMIPGAILALLPKCPACLAAYVAIGTGVSLSISGATYLRMAFLILCVGSLSYLTAKTLRRFIPLIWTWLRY